MADTRETDVVVIGAGSGGLTAAAYLAAAGRGVTVIDRGYTAGGHAAVFTREGYQFDIGLWLLTSTRDAAPAIQPFLEPLGIEVQFNRVEPIESLVLADGSRFEVPWGWDAFRSRLAETLPSERQAIERYLGVVNAIDAMTAQRGHAPALSEVPDRVRQAGVMLRHSRDTVAGFWDSLGLSARARTILGWLHSTYAVAPSEASLFWHALATASLVRGVWYPHGGGGVISDRLAEVVRRNGGQVLMRHEVERITVDGQTVTGVVATGPDGDAVRVAAPVVVAAGDIKHTYLQLLDPAVVPAKLRRKVRGYEMALPLAVLYLVIDRDLAAEGWPAANLRVLPTDDLQGMYDRLRGGDVPDEVAVSITSASLKDPDNPRLCPPGQTNLQVATVVPPQHSAWGLKVGEQRGEAYQAAKQEWTRRMLASAEKAVPGLRDTVVYADLATPFTDTRYTGVTNGTSYGIAATPDQMLWNRPGSGTHLTGLYLAGASTRTGSSITGTMAGGIEAATAILGRPATKAVSNV